MIRISNGHRRRSRGFPFRLGELGSMVEHGFVDLLVEANTLKTDAGNLQCTCVVELIDFVDILGGNISTPGYGILDEIIGCLMKRLSLRRRYV